MESSHIVLLLDKSASMMSQKSATIRAVNAMVAKQKELAGDRGSAIMFEVVTFDTEVKFGESHPLVEFPTFVDYTPSGGTALYDAIGMTLDKFRDETDVVMVIATDGQENSSCHYNQLLTNKMIAEFKTKKEWTFIYLAEGPGTFAQGTDIGFRDSYGTANVHVECLSMCLGAGQFNESLSQAVKGQKMNLNYTTQQRTPKKPEAPAPSSPKQTKKQRDVFVYKKLNKI